jgi:GNAT superfamily N-acetyltransferase
MNDRIIIEKLHYKHSTLDFDCSDDDINNYFYERSYEDVDINNSKVYVFIKDDEILGFYAISTKSVRFEVNNSKKDWPLLLIGQLGVNKQYQGQGWGPFILSKALDKCINISQDVGCVGVLIETFKERLIQGFFKKAGFSIIETRNVKGKNKPKSLLFYKFPTYGI